jgi:hypothetical protein
MIVLVGFDLIKREDPLHIGMYKKITCNRNYDLESFLYALIIKKA